MVATCARNSNTSTKIKSPLFYMFVSGPRTKYRFVIIEKNDRSDAAQIK